MACFLKYLKETSISIPNNVDVNGVTHYDIHVNVGGVTWTVQHRFREFVELNDKLVSGHSISKDLLPPKKVLGNRSPTFLEQRQKQLETYLQRVLIFLQFTMCREFVEFLEFNKFDIIYLLQDMAETFYQQGETILNQSNCYEFSPLELYAITERLKLPCPTTICLKKIYDFSHVLDFCCRLESVSLVLVKKKDTTNTSNVTRHSSIGTSNIVPGNLKFDFNAFRALNRLQINGISTENICDAATIRNTLQTLRVQNGNITKLNEIILCDCIHRTTTTTGDHQLDTTKQWQQLETADFSANQISAIDNSVQLLPKLKELILDCNQIKTISKLNGLPYLRTLSLCENLITECIDCHLELGNLKTLNLSQNQIKSLAGFRKMYSLVTLNVSCNIIENIDEVDHIAGLPCLEELILTGNPVAGVVDYRSRVLSRFGNRSNELYLDNEKAGQAELDVALVLAALRQSQLQPKFDQTNPFINR